jgi:hypothetical protein
MSSPAQPHTPFFRHFMTALVVWGTLVALRAFIGPEFWSREPAAAATTRPYSLTPAFDIRKPLIIVGTVGLFVGGWGWLLYQRQRRMNRESAERL